MTKKPKIDFAVGGQAVIEGVMMRSPNHYTVAVRDPEGKIQTKIEAYTSITERVAFFKWPLIRGVVHLIESMKIGFSALDYSNDVFLGEVDKDTSDRHPALKILFAVLGILYVLGTMAFTLFLLKFIPLWVAGKAAELWPAVQDNYLLFNAIDGVTKISIFIGYILLISLLKDIRRVFQYHGAEHKSIFAYEAGLPLTVENARKQTRFHPRCGTSFIFIVILMSVFIYTIIPPAGSFWGMLAQRIIIIPVIAGVSYEMLKGSAKFQDHLIMRLFSLPGLLIQRLTTKEPDDEQLEVALHSLKVSLESEGITLA